MIARRLPESRWALALARIYLIYWCPRGEPKPPTPYTSRSSCPRHSRLTPTCWLAGIAPQHQRRCALHNYPGKHGFDSPDGNWLSDVFPFLPFQGAVTVP